MKMIVLPSGKRHCPAVNVPLKVDYVLKIEVSRRESIVSELIASQCTMLIFSFRLMMILKLQINANNIIL